MAQAIHFSGRLTCCLVKNDGTECHNFAVAPPAGYEVEFPACPFHFPGKDSATYRKEVDEKGDGQPEAQSEDYVSLTIGEIKEIADFVYGEMKKEGKLEEMKIYLEKITK